MSGPFRYIGKELELFQLATCWKAYLYRTVKPYLSGKVLEVGAGIGATTRALNKGNIALWVMLEPDRAMYEQNSDADAPFPPNVHHLHGSIADVTGRFDTILYIDVLEHIADDRTELAAAAAHLVPGGHLVVLAPAFPFLYTPFDKAIGHYRRYTRPMLAEIAPAGLVCKKMQYLDTMGFLAGIANRLLLRQQMPTRKQILFWDRLLVRISTIADRVVGHSIGKSVVAVWQKPI